MAAAHDWLKVRHCCHEPNMQTTGEEHLGYFQRNLETAKNEQQFTKRCYCRISHALPRWGWNKSNTRKKQVFSRGTRRGAPRPAILLVLGWNPAPVPPHRPRTTSTGPFPEHGTCWPLLQGLVGFSIISNNLILALPSWDKYIHKSPSYNKMASQGCFSNVCSCSLMSQWSCGQKTFTITL